MMLLQLKQCVNILSLDADADAAGASGESKLKSMHPIMRD